MAESDNSQEKEPTWKDAIVLVVLRLVDAGLAPWVAVALFLLAGMWLCMRNLDSKDTFNLLSGIGTAHGLAWVGWIFAFSEIPICRWALNREKNIRKNKLKRLEEEHAKALDMLKKYKADELKLENG
jgi:hypothetical protein